MKGILSNTGINILSGILIFLLIIFPLFAEALAKTDFPFFFTTTFTTAFFSTFGITFTSGILISLPGPVISTVAFTLFLYLIFLEIPKIIFAFGFSRLMALLILSTSNIFKLSPPAILNNIFSAVKLLFWYKGLCKIFSAMAWARFLPDASVVFKNAKFPF